MTSVTSTTNEMINARSYASANGTLYRGLAADLRIADDPIKGDLVRSRGEAFCTYLSAAEQLARRVGVKNPEIIAGYSTYLACRVIETTVKSLPSFQSGPLVSYAFTKFPEMQSGNIDMITKTTLEGMVAALARKTSRPTNVAQAYFAESANRAYRYVTENSPEEFQKKIREAKVVINDATVNGFYGLVIDTATTDSGPQQKRQESLTRAAEGNPARKPFQRITIEDAIPREHIIGDQSVIDALEHAVEDVFAYNAKAGKNILIESKRFKNSILLAGPPGEGKTTLAKYMAAHAQNIALNLKNKGYLTVPFETIQFNLDSEWKSGMVLSARRQFEKISDGKGIYFIFQDEIHRLLSKIGGKNDVELNGIQQEFRTFMQGTYKNRGNYIFVATINDVEDIAEANRSRFRVINWRGAQTAQDKARMFEYQLGNSAFQGASPITKEEYLKLGELAQVNGLHGRHIEDACAKAKEVMEARENASTLWGKEWDEQVRTVKLMPMPNATVVRTILLEQAEHRARSIEDSART